MRQQLGSEGDRIHAVEGLPRLDFEGRAPLEFPGMVRALQLPHKYWSSACLDARVLEARVGERRMVMLTDPPTVVRVLQNRGGLYPRSRLHDRVLGSSFGDTLLQGEEMEWPAWRQAFLSPIQGAQERTTVERVARACSHVLSGWTEGPVDLFRGARHLTMQALWRAFFCTEEEAAESDPLLEATAEDMDRLAYAPLRDQIACLRPLSARAVAVRAKDFGEPYRMLNTALLFLHAGHDNAAATLTWALWLLARHPDIQARVRDEWGSGPGPADPARDLRSCPLTSAVIHETLRLYPPIPQILRDVTVDLDVSGEVVPGGFTAVLGVYPMHRNRDLWERPDDFVPDRFMGADLSVHRKLWLPFGAGPRGCVGTSFAFLVLSRAIGHVVGAYDLSPNPGQDLTCWVDFALRPHGRAPIRVRPRAR